ncbi:MAG: sugar ABC transporter permease [Candidatus Bathyarchaeia archaeon]
MPLSKYRNPFSSFSNTSTPLKGNRRNKRNPSYVYPYLWCLPAIIIAVVTVYYPMVFSFLLSLTDYRFGAIASNFIGLDNYVKAIVSGDFVNSLKITFTFVFSAVLIEFLFGLGLALFLNTVTKGETVIKALLTIPISITPIVAGLMWKWILEPEVGILNYFLELLNQQKQLWLSDPNMALWVVVLTDVWRQTPFVVIVLLASLSAIPRDMYEAALIDGAGMWSRFRNITLYYIRPAMFVVLLSLTATAFKVYDIVYILTHGGPAGATKVLSFEIYRIGFKFSNIAYASAMSFLMLGICMIISCVYLFVIYPKEYR